MPRKKVAEAHAEQKAKSSARIRYLIRNPVFQEEFNELRKLVAQEDDIAAQLDRVRKFEDRWGVPFLPNKSHWVESRSCDDAGLYRFSINSLFHVKKGDHWGPQSLSRFLNSRTTFRGSLSSLTPKNFGCLR